MKTNEFNTNNPPKAGTYKVLYRRAKSTETNVGTAKYTKKNGWSAVIGKSGKKLYTTYNNVSAQEARATPKILGWA